MVELKNKASQEEKELGEAGVAQFMLGVKCESLGSIEIEPKVLVASVVSDSSQPYGL